MIRYGARKCDNQFKSSHSDELFGTHQDLILDGIAILQDDFHEPFIDNGNALIRFVESA